MPGTGQFQRNPSSMAWGTASISFDGVKLIWVLQQSGEHAGKAIEAWYPRPHSSTGEKGDDDVVRQAFAIDFGDGHG